MDRRAGRAWEPLGRAVGAAVMAALGRAGGAAMMAALRRDGGAAAMMAAMWGLGAVLGLFGLAGLAGLGGSAQAAEGAEIWRGVVERVVDGDTVSLLTGDYERLRIRLYGVDAPERGQEGGGESTRALTRLIGGREVEVVVEDVDRYGRQVGLIYLDGENVNLQLVAEGHAWVYDRYCVRRDVCGAMAEAQRRARAQGLGVWGEPDPVPPWEHRRR